jgi:hypothetical protein
VGDGKSKALRLNGFPISPPHNHPDFHSISSEWTEFRPSETEKGNSQSLISVMMAGQRQRELKLRSDSLQISIRTKHQKAEYQKRKEESHMIEPFSFLLVHTFAGPHIDRSSEIQTSVWTRVQSAGRNSMDRNPTNSMDRNPTNSSLTGIFGTI